MNKKITGIVSYFSWIGWLIAFLAGDREGAKFHLNQSLVLLLVSFVNSSIIGRFLPSVSIILGYAWFVLWIVGFIHAVCESEKELPLIGCIKILN